MESAFWEAAHPHLPQLPAAFQNSSVTQPCSHPRGPPPPRAAAWACHRSSESHRSEGQQASWPSSTPPGSPMRLPAGRSPSSASPEDERPEQQHAQGLKSHTETYKAPSLFLTQTDGLASLLKKKAKQCMNPGPDRRRVWIKGGQINQTKPGQVTTENGQMMTAFLGVGKPPDTRRVLR